MIYKFTLLPIVLCAVVMSGCVHHAGGIAPSTIPLSPDSYRILGNVKGQDCVYYLFGLIPVSNGNETRVAVHKALSREPSATALINVTSDTFSQWFVAVTRTCTQVYGTAVTTN